MIRSSLLILATLGNTCFAFAPPICRHAGAPCCDAGAFTVATARVLSVPPCCARRAARSPAIAPDAPRAERPACDPVAARACDLLLAGSRSASPDLIVTPAAPSLPRPETCAELADGDARVPHVPRRDRSPPLRL